MKKIMLSVLCILTVIGSVAFNDFSLNASEVMPRTWCSMDWWATAGGYNDNDYENYKCGGSYNYVNYKAGFLYNQTPNGGDYNKAGLYVYSNGGGGYKCGFPQVAPPGDPDEGRKDGAKVCSGDGEKRSSSIKIGALSGRDWNSFITTT